ncbi:hypothetical protein EG835_01470 [bacterium]|nr:hypothetical protein [bacterium]
MTDLLQNFEACLDAFEVDARFSGPSWYFHEKAIAARQSRGLRSILEDDGWFDLLYATLTAWGMHRMGPGGAKLRELDEIKASVRAHADQIDALSTLDITRLEHGQALVVAREVWSLIEGLKVSASQARIVANSKTLHHLLPDLVPPIDREYTFRFFYGRNMLSIPEREAFLEVYTQLCMIARDSAAIVSTRLDDHWNTSKSKVIDNAIIGYMRSRAPRKSDHRVGHSDRGPGRPGKGRSKYDPLGEYFRECASDRLRLSYAEIEAIIGFELPASSRDHSAAFWANSYAGGVWKKQWLDAGWKVDSHSVTGERVVFVRTGSPQA